MAARLSFGSWRRVASDGLRAFSMHAPQALGLTMDLRIKSPRSLRRVEAGERITLQVRKPLRAHAGQARVCMFHLVKAIHGAMVDL